MRIYALAALGRTADALADLDRLAPTLDPATVERIRADVTGAGGRR